MYIRLQIYLLNTISVLHCVDHNHLKGKSLSEVFPPLCLFPQVSHSVHSRRIAVGTRSGELALYEMRSSKVQTLKGVHGGGPVLAVAYSPEGKHLATYSAADNRLHFWQTSTGMFGLGTVKLHVTAHIILLHLLLMCNGIHQLIHLN